MPPRPELLSLRKLWAATLGVLFLALMARAFAPLARLWDVTILDQAGQLTVYNSIVTGGKDGLPVEIGDLNGDGHDDLILAPMAAPSNGSTRPTAGEIYVYRGDGKIAGVIDRARPTEVPQSLTILGAHAGDYLGTELFLADVNGDRISDLIIGAQNYDGPNQDCDTCGGVFVILGNADLLDGNRVIDLNALESAPGVITVVGPSPGGRLGIWVEAGDLDADGFADLLLGADQVPGDSPDAERKHVGQTHVIYGRPGFPPLLDLAKPVAETSRILGADSEDHFGSCIHSRDLNADGREDLIVAAAINRLSAGRNPFSNLEADGGGAADGPNNARPECGEVYVFFGPAGGGRLPPLIDLSQTLPPEVKDRVTIIYGAQEQDGLGEELTAGDFNGDGFPDLAIGGLIGRGPGENRGGITEVVYWQAGLEGKEIDLSPLAVDRLPAGLKVSKLFGAKRLDLLGDTLSAADVNHDGFDDLAVGIPHEIVNSRSKAGAVAVVFGRNEPWPAFWTPQANELPPELEVAFILGSQAEDLLSYSMEVRDYDRDGYADIFPNAMHGDGARDLANTAGEAYLVSGFHLSGAVVGVKKLMPISSLVGAATTVDVFGSGFTTLADTRVFVGEEPAQVLRVLTANHLRARFPASAAAGKFDVRIENRHGTSTLAAAFERLEISVFVRGDANLDGRLDLSDPVHTLGGLFQGTPIRCLDAHDANDDGVLNTTDVLYTLGYLFLGGPAPPPPFPLAGRDETTGDNLDCR